MSATPTPADYPHRELFLGPNPDARLCTVLIEHGTDPTALDLDQLRDCIADKLHLLMVARDRASLALFAAAFRRLVEQSPADPVH